MVCYFNSADTWPLITLPELTCIIPSLWFLSIRYYAVLRSLLPSALSPRIRKVLNYLCARLHQGLQRYQGKTRHISAGSVKLYQTLGFPGDFSLGSTTACAENAYPLHPFNLCVGLFHSGDIPMVALCMKGISHLIPSSLLNLQSGDLDSWSFKSFTKQKCWRAGEDPVTQLKMQLLSHPLSSSWVMYELSACCYEHNNPQRHT